MNLTNLQLVKQWLGIPTLTTTDDALLTQLITSCSNFIQNYIQRPDLVKTALIEMYSGTGQRRIMLRNWPIVSVSSVKINSSTIPATQQLGQNGFTVAGNSSSRAGVPQSIALTGSVFTPGDNNVQISYVAGYVVQNEAQTVPASGATTLKPNCPNGPWSQDDGVTLANGTALTLVTGSPGALEYAVTTDAATGLTTYTFNAAQAGAGVLLSYSYVPSDLNEVANELIAERYKYKSRIGEVSKSMNGAETTSYSLKDLQDWQKTALMPFRRSFPL